MDAVIDLRLVRLRDGRWRLSIEGVLCGIAETPHGCLGLASAVLVKDAEAQREASEAQDPSPHELPFEPV